MCIKLGGVLNLKSFITTNLYDIDIRQINTIYEVYKNKGNNQKIVPSLDFPELFDNLKLPK